MITSTRWTPSKVRRVAHKCGTHHHCFADGNRHQQPMFKPRSHHGRREARLGPNTEESKATSLRLKSGTSSTIVLLFPFAVRFFNLPFAVAFPTWRISTAELLSPFLRTNLLLLIPHISIAKPQIVGTIELKKPRSNRRQQTTAFCFRRRRSFCLRSCSSIVTATVAEIPAY